MYMTLEQARRRLSGYNHAFGVTDVRDAINNAIQSLSGLSGWECLRRVVRISSATPAFALPQGCAGLVRACVNGRPVTVRGQDFQFVHSGPGDLSRPPFGFRRVRTENVCDLGEMPYMVVPPPKFRLSATCTGADDPDVDEPSITVKGVDFDTGEIVTDAVPVNGAVGERHFSAVLDVVLDPDASRYVELKWVVDDGPSVVAAKYHPDVLVPRFRHYCLDSAKPGPVDLLVETRIDPLPLMDPTDVLPFQSVEPIEFMIMYDWKMQSSEVESARKYKEEAIAWLKAQEVTNDTVQTEIVLNSPMRGSLGELSMYSANV